MKTLENKWEGRIKELKHINDQMTRKLRSLEETKELAEDLQKRYTEAVQIIDNQKRDLHQMNQDNDEI